MEDTEITASTQEAETAPHSSGPDSTVAERAKQARRQQRRSAWARRLPLLPALLFTIVVTQVPFIVALWYSLNEWRFLSPNSFKWTGIDNFIGLADDRFFREAAWNTFLITFLTVFFATVLGITVAVLLDRKFFGRAIARTLIITPFLIMPVAASLVWRNGFLDATYGIFNYVIGVFGGDSVGFTSSHPMFSVVLVLVWQWTPFLTLIFLAGLQSQNQSVLEAARVDGASPHSIFFQLTLPHLRRYIELGILLGSIYIIQSFDVVDQVVGGAIGAKNIPYFVYERSIGGGWRFGEASAYGVVVVVASLILANLALRILSRLLEGEEAA